MLKLRKVPNYIPKQPLVVVGIADLKVSTNPKVLATYALGSCVAITIYDARRRLGALIHAMLPEPKGNVDNPAKYVSTAIPHALKHLKNLGSPCVGLEACLVGGANILKSATNFRIGERNVSVAREVLRRYGIRLVCEDVGGHSSRNVFFNLTNGEVYVTSPRVKLGILGRKLLGGKYGGSK